MLKKNSIAICFCFFQLALFAQSDSAKAFSFSGYGEVYYSYDFSNPSNHEKSNFIYNHKKHNEINLNLAFAKVAYAKKNIRANLAVMFGTYAHYNLAAEPIWARFIYEANLGVKISKKENIWIDAGILPSHIGFESAVGADCWTLTRSMLAEGSPYFETGAKLSYTNKKETFSGALLVLNGWQRVIKPDYLHRPSFGLQLTYKPQSNFTINYSNFIGTDKPDSLNAWRIFHDIYVVYEPIKQFGITAGLDIGTDKYDAKNYGVWYSPVVILRYNINQKFRLAARGEYYVDKNQIIVTTNTSNGFQTFGASANFDYQINDKLLWRIEGKGYFSKDPIFNFAQKNNFSITTALSVKL